MALLRFIDADPASSGIDIWSSGARIFTNVAFRAITPYIEVTPHVGQFQLRETGGTQNVAENRQEMLAGRHYTLVALPKGYRSSRLAVVRDDLGALEPGESMMRLINATVGVDDIDLYLEDTNTRIGHGVDPSAANSFSVVKPGMFEIRQAGQPALKRLTNLKVEADRSYTFIVRHGGWSGRTSS